MNQQLPPQKQTIYPVVQISVGDVGPGQRAIIIDTPTDGQLVFPMSNDACKQIGTALVAPGVVLPDHQQNGPVGS